MFKNLTNFGYHRSGKEAFGFYLAYLLLVVVIGALIGAFVGVATQGSIGLSRGVSLGAIAAALVCIALSFLILSTKKVWRFGWILLSLLAGGLALFGGGILGVIIPAYFTTLHSAATPSAPTQ